MLSSSASSLRLRSLPSSLRRWNAVRRLATQDAAPAEEDLQKTALYDMHKSLFADMVPFAGYWLPIMYKGDLSRTGILKEHLWCRAPGKASLFDVSHMGQVRIWGEDRVKFLERVVVGDIAGLKEKQAILSLITDQSGGIIDDTVISHAGDHIYMVINGATKTTDLQHFAEVLQTFEGDVHLNTMDVTHQLLALQGSGAAAALQPLLPSDFDLSKMAFMTGVPMTIDGVEDCRITRCGYTGEDGFEISIPTEQAVALAGKLLENPTVNPAGLGARDSLRLEAGLCLYGHDIDRTINPVEAGLGWTISARRRAEGGFLGAEHIIGASGKLKKATKKRVGIVGMQIPAREGSIIYDMEGKNEIGRVTSGTYSPTLKKPISMGYVLAEYAKVETPLCLKIREKIQIGLVTKMPFVEPKYYRLPEEE